MARILKVDEKRGIEKFHAELLHWADFFS